MPPDDVIRGLQAPRDISSAMTRNDSDKPPKSSANEHNEPEPDAAADKAKTKASDPYGAAFASLALGIQLDMQQSEMTGKVRNDGNWGVAGT